ncbi:MAG: DMT family transporter [Chloroflexota bacterium]
MTNRQVGLIAILFSISGYALLPIFTRTIYETTALRPTDLAIWRFIFATPAIWLVIYFREALSSKPRKKRDSRGQILRMLSLGLLYTGATLSAFFGLNYIPASLYVVLFYTYPVMVALISVFLGQKLHLMAWLAISLTLVGVILTVPDLSIAGENTILGLSIAVFNALVVAIYFVLISREMPKMSSGSRGAAYVITGTLIILLLLIPFFGLQFPQSPQAWGLLVAMAIWSTAMPIFVVIVAIQYLGAAQAAIISTSEPIATMILAMIILNEVVLPIQWLGAIFIILGVIVLEVRPKGKTSTTIP